MGNIIREKSQQKHAESTWCRLVPNLDPLTVGMVKKETTASGGGDPSPSDNAVLCAAVHQFLTGVDPKLPRCSSTKTTRLIRTCQAMYPRTSLLWAKSWHHIRTNENPQRTMLQLPKPRS